MSTSTAPVAQAEDRRQAEADERTDLFRRFLQAGIANPAMLPRVPDDAIFFLVPDDDPSFAERVIIAATGSARRGHNVYLHHIRLADLPELPSERTGPPVGMRRTRFNRDGSIAEQEVCGPDGEWHQVDPPEPVDE